MFSNVVATVVNKLYYKIFSNLKRFEATDITFIHLVYSFV